MLVSIMSKHQPLKNDPIGTVAPISKKPSAGSTGKSGAGQSSKSGKSGSGLSGGKGANMFGSTPKTTKTSFGSSGKNSLGSESKSNSSTFGSSAKTSTFATSGKTSSPTSKTPSFIPLGSTGKSKFGSSDKKEAVPLVLGGKTTSVFASSPSKSYPSTSFASPKKSRSAFGVIWIPGRKRNKKKEYVHVSHRDDGYRDKSPSMFPFERRDYMSGDSGSHAIKKEEDRSLLVGERPKGPIATAASAGAVVAINDKPPPVPVPENMNTSTNNEEKDEKSEFIKYNKEEGKEAAGDAHFLDEKDDKSFLENDSESPRFSETNNLKDRGDKVDSVYLRPPPPHKVRSNASTTDDEDCGIKCLYYTLQCCDCVLIIVSLFTPDSKNPIYCIAGIAFEPG